MRLEQLHESTPAVLELEPLQESTLRRLGAHLASSRTWWGSSGAREASDRRSVIRVEPAGGRRFRVTVLNMIGSIAFEGVQLQILPKIPLRHFMYLIQECGIAPRSVGSAQLVTDDSLAEVVAHWFLSAAELLLRKGLRSDYLERSEELSAIRGQVQLLETALLVQQGRPAAVCRFDELAPDSPLNRLIKGAANAIASSPQFSKQVRNRARMVRLQMPSVGREVSSDYHATVDRLASDYTAAVPLAKMVLLGMGIGFHVGDVAGKSFLIRTPDLVEECLRNLIARILPDASVKAGKLVLGSSGLSMNPDLVIDKGSAVGDIKYKLQTMHWNRSDLYQSLAFAAAYRAVDVLLVSFHQGEVPTPTQLKVGEIRCRMVAWDARPDVSPQIAHRQFEKEVIDWHSARCDSLRCQGYREINSSDA